MFLPTPARCRRAAWSLLTAGLLGLCAPVWAETAQAHGNTGADATEALDAADAPDETDTPATGPSSPRTPARRPTVAAPRFALDVQAPDEVRELLLRHLDLQRFVHLRNLDANELSRLLLEVPANARSLLGTRGYFSPNIEVEHRAVEASTNPATEQTHPLGTVTVNADPGVPSTVRSVEVFFSGPIAAAPEAQAQREAIEHEARLLVSKTFTQADWDRMKTEAVRGLTARRYPAGRLETSLADVDAEAREVHLYVELDSGPVRRIGEVQIEGAERYDPDMTERIVRLAGLTPGSEYDLASLQRAQQRVIESGYFDAAFVYVEPGQDDTAPLPVKVQLREAKRQKLVLGVGGSTDNGARLSLEHIHHRVPGLDWRAKTVLQLERQDRLASTEWSSPIDAKGWRWISDLKLARQLDGTLTTTSQRVRAGRAQDSESDDRSFYLQYDRARTDSALLRSLQGVQTDSSLTANSAWTRRRFDNTLSPHAGHGLAVELGAGYTLGTDRQPFARTQARWLSYWPLGLAVNEGSSAAAPSRLGRLALRAEVGAVVARDSAPVPDTQLFLAGGDASVRGYGLREIGIPQADGSVTAGRYKAVLSLEWQRPIGGDGTRRTPLEHVVFIDGGAVADRTSDLTPRWGVGTGVRYNSPVGPLQLDLAYGLKTHRLRLHLNVGFVF